MIKNFILVSIFLSLLGSYSFAQETVSKDTLITMERMPGFFGACPFYKLTISSDGIVELEPKDYNNENKEKIVTGKIIKSRISQEQLKQLVSEFERTEFYSLEDTFENKENDRKLCPEHWTHSATTFTSITINGKSKKVQHYQGCKGSEMLTKLTNLENKIDEVVNIKQWIDCYRGKNRVILAN